MVQQQSVKWYRWDDMPKESVTEMLDRRLITGDQMMLALSTYMGHAEIFYTYWYLTAVPELMALAGGKFECFANLAGDGDE